ncbi:Ig-like domain-containing protein [Pseudoalteromonas denitrificans]|uniref:Cadherin-like domain-containing protein n=1 Tax=Pseudoalteromonas denitrificans DSM 6059 TaxID=1123010 RepID=A0A1I1USU4_9GAMM|nr:Ig-like domain-containing protein [Pseudoalteromonas denitrificans]SFD71883.1 hypothetical protein SAMN02745724_05277 [Pseudoalteromonas denitrificans DSM 6059]
MKPVIKFTNSILMLSLLIGCGGGGSDKEKPVVKPKPVNQAPIAIDDVAAIFKDQQITIDVLANDTDTDKDQLTITAVTAINGGTPSINNNKILFIAEPGFTGAAQFIYTISDGSKQTSQAIVDVKVLSTSDKVVMLKTQVDNNITTTIADINEQGINCQDKEPKLGTAMCDFKDVAFNDRQFIAEKTLAEQTILVLDYGFNYQANIRYRSRIKALLKYNPEAQKFTDYNPSISISNIGDKVLSEIDNFKFTDEQGNQSPAFVSASWFNLLAPIMKEMDTDDGFDYRTGESYASHSASVLPYLMETNPQANFVLVEFGDDLLQSHPDLLCNIATEELTEISEKVAIDFRNNILKKYQVGFINMSAGHSVKAVKINWLNAQCTGGLSDQNAHLLVNTLSPLYKAIHATDGVISVQALDYGLNEQNFPLEAMEFKNRVKVLPYTTNAEDTLLPIDGKVDAVKPVNNADDWFRERDWTDYYVNFGVERFSFGTVFNSTPKLTFGLSGIGSAIESYIFPSWAAPVALSHIIYLKNTLFQNETMDQNTVNKLLNSLTPEGCSFYPEFNNRCRIQDPLKHRQHEAYRLGYLE